VEQPKLTHAHTHINNSS